MADFSAIDGAVRGVILSIINSMFTLPNRFLLTLDAKNDYFKTYLPPQGVMRITVEKAWDFAEEAQGKAKKIFAKLTRAAPDCYAKVELGAEPLWQTATKDNTVNPSWNETHDFVVSDFHQCIKVHIFDKDVNGDDEVGLGVTTVDEILRNGGRQELALEMKGEQTGGKVSIAAEYFKLEADGGKSFTSSSHTPPPSLVTDESESKRNSRSTFLPASTLKSIDLWRKPELAKLPLSVNITVRWPLLRSTAATLNVS